jgi:hypothetical protein
MELNINSFQKEIPKPCGREILLTPETGTTARVEAGYRRRNETETMRKEKNRGRND